MVVVEVDLQGVLAARQLEHRVERRDARTHQPDADAARQRRPRHQRARAVRRLERSVEVDAAKGAVRARALRQHPRAAAAAAIAAAAAAAAAIAAAAAAAAVAAAAAAAAARAAIRRREEPPGLAQLLHARALDGDAGVEEDERHDDEREDEHVGAHDVHALEHVERDADEERHHDRDVRVDLVVVRGEDLVHVLELERVGGRDEHGELDHLVPDAREEAGDDRSRHEADEGGDLLGAAERVEGRAD